MHQLENVTLVLLILWCPAILETPKSTVSHTGTAEFLLLAAFVPVSMCGVHCCMPSRTCSKDQSLTSTLSHLSSFWLSCLTHSMILKRRSSSPCCCTNAQPSSMPTVCSSPNRYGGFLCRNNIAYTTRKRLMIPSLRESEDLLCLKRAYDGAYCDQKLELSRHRMAKWQVKWRGVKHTGILQGVTSKEKEWFLA